jgi:hypothetical protein
MASVKETVKETLVGSTGAPELSHQARSNFLRHAQKDENGELYMTEDDFINAVAPKQEDYVSTTLDPLHSLPPRRLQSLAISEPVENTPADTFPNPAQNQARAIWHPIPSGRPTEDWQA